MLKDTLSAMFRAVDARRLKSLGQFYATDCQYERPGFSVISGLAALAHFYEHVRPIAHGRHRLHTVLQDGVHLCAVGEFSGVLRSGRSIELQFMDLYVFQRGLIVKRKTFFFTPLA
jgi:hypothetical protein